MHSRSKASLSRRKFLKGSALAAGSAGLLTTGSALAASDVAKVKRAKNLIFLVPDGMCQGTLGLAHHWHHRIKGKPLNWMKLYDRADLRLAMQETASASSPVTDSAAAATAWGSGTRVMNRALNTTPDGKSLKPIMQFAKEAGKATGLVSTCRITHATPAGFTASVPHRDQEDEIAKQYLDLEIDVILGGGYRHFKGEGQNLLPNFAKKGYSLCRTEFELSAAKGSPQLLGLFSNSHIPYAIDRQSDTSLADVPELKTMFQAALESLKASKEGFVLQVEAGRVDHAGHANDPATILHELLEFDACLPVAVDFIEKNPDTLLIVTTDHGTGGCQLDGVGRGYNGSGPALDRIGSITHSFEWLEKHFRKLGKVDPQLIEVAFGFQPTAEQVQSLEEALGDPTVHYFSSSIAETFRDHFVQLTATGWTSHSHTSENVELLAFGPGSEKVSGFVENREVFDIMTSALGIA